MSACLLSVVIPAYGRVEPLKHTLRSTARAIEALGDDAEIVLVDDGSAPPLGEALGAFEIGARVRHLRQPNQGSIVARLTGLQAAQGEYVQFLDSDDLVHPDKFRAQIGGMRAAHADVGYSDMARAELGGDYGVARFFADAVTPPADTPAEFFLKLQPAPHNPLYRRDHLLRALSPPLVAPRRTMDASGDVWLYYCLAIHPARLVRIPGAYAAPGPHEESRYSQHWEKLGVASLQIMEAFLRACPPTAETRAAREAMGEMAFRTWRGLPRGFHAGFEQRMLELWRRAPHGPLSRLGAPSFAAFARLLGPINAGRLIRAYRAKPYAGARTLSPEAYASLFATLK